MALGLVATLRGMPQIYSGDEIGMEGGQDPDNRRDFPGGLPADIENAFTKAGRTPVEQEVFAWTSGILALRVAHSELQTGLEQNLFADDDGFAFARAQETGGCAATPASGSSENRILIVINKAQRAKTMDLPVDETALAGCTKFLVEAPTKGTMPVAYGGKLRIEEPAESITVNDVR